MSEAYSIPERVKFKMALHLQKNKVRSQLRAPLISFTFDDFPKSAVEDGAAKLEAEGLLGTFFPAAKLCGQTENGIRHYDHEDLSRLAEAGHEIGCHSYSHAQLIRLNKSQVDAELAQNRAFIRDAVKDQNVSSFAYPFGAVSPAVKQVAQSHYSICRGAWPGVNAGQIDMSLLKITALEPDKLSLDQAKSLFEEARDLNAWTIFMVHDIQADPSFCGTTPEHFNDIVDAVVASGIEVLPLRSAAAKVVFG
ncbi:MAG: polysaccharide deacetylase family protein [Pseudomonadota bacterium]